MTAPVPGPLATDASLHLFADHLADALASGELPPSLLHVGGVDGTGFDLGTLPLGDDHPTDLLVGLTAPGDWHALGLATGGWAYHVEERGDPDRRRTRVHVVTLLTRSGEVVHRTRSDDASLARTLSEEVPAGEQIDLLRLALGLATDPPPCGAEVYWTIQWLAALAAAGTPAPRNLAEALEHHPAFRLLEAADSHAAGDAADVLDGFHRVCTWRRLQLLAAEGAWPAPELRADEVPWFDEGAFARFLLNRVPSLGAVRNEALDALGEETAASVGDLLDTLGIPDTAWPDRAPHPPAA